MNDRIEEIKARKAAITPGQWGRFVNDNEYVFDVGWSAQYPTQADQYRSRVWIRAESYPTAMADAVCMVAARKSVAMITSAVYVE